jgi:hypothetical protein
MVKYEDINDHVPGSIYDFKDEYEGIRKLQKQELVSVELNGHTHMNPDVSWVSSNLNNLQKAGVKEFIDLKE